MLGQGRDEACRHPPERPNGLGCEGAPAEPARALAALWHGLEGAPRSPGELYLRFERGRRLRGGAAQVAVLVSWQARRVRAGEAQALVVLTEAEAGELRRDCLAYGLRIVDNVP